MNISQRWRWGRDLNINQSGRDTRCLSNYGVQNQQAESDPGRQRPRSIKSSKYRSKTLI